MRRSATRLRRGSWRLRGDGVPFARVPGGITPSARTISTKRRSVTRRARRIRSCRAPVRRWPRTMRRMTARTRAWDRRRGRSSGILGASRATIVRSGLAIERGTAVIRARSMVLRGPRRAVQARGASAGRMGASEGVLPCRPSTKDGVKATHGRGHGSQGRAPPRDSCACPSQSLVGRRPWSSSSDAGPTSSVGHVRLSLRRARSFARRRPWSLEEPRPSVAATPSAGKYGLFLLVRKWRHGRPSKKDQKSIAPTAHPPKTEPLFK